jgi:VanZ family protein
MAGWRGRVWVWLPVAVMCVVIACESTSTFSAQNTSGWIRPWIERLIGHRINDFVWNVGHHMARKSGHFTGYGLLCLAWLRAWLLTLALRPGPWWRMRAAVLAVAGTALVASLDEWHQTFLPTRTGMFSDVVLDTIGGMTMCGLVWLICWRTRGMRERTAESRSLETVGR